jgi:outer membrane lipoprotein SlyB
MSRVEIMFGSCMMGALAGPVLGSIVGAAVGQWENIAVTCEFK